MIGKILKYMRKSKDLKQKEIADMLRFKCNTLSQYENNNRQATFDTIEKIANYCGFEVIFRNKKTNEEINSSNIDKK